MTKRKIEEIDNYLEFLNSEYDYLVKIKLFLVTVPEMIANGNINQLEFQGFMEKYEVETSGFMFRKSTHKELIAKKLHVKPDQVSFKLLVHLGYKEFEEKGRQVVKITNEISQGLNKIIIYLKNFSKMQQEFQRLNSFLYQEDYSPRGIGRETAYNYNRGRNFYGEA